MDLLKEPIMFSDVSIGILCQAISRIYQGNSNDISNLLLSLSATYLDGNWIGNCRNSLDNKSPCFPFDCRQFVFEQFTLSQLSIANNFVSMGNNQMHFHGKTSHKQEILEAYVSNELML
jgi:hypothetical protein